MSYGCVSAEEFVSIWQESSSAKEAAQRMGDGISYDAVRARASFYRRRGIPLKRFAPKVPKHLDVAALTSRARKPA